MQAELPWPSGPVENPLRIDPEGHPKVVGSSDLLPHHPKSNFKVIYVSCLKKCICFFSLFFSCLRGIHLENFLPNFGLMGFCEQIEPNSEFKRLRS